MKKYQNKIISIPNLYRDLMVHFGSKGTLRKVLCNMWTKKQQLTQLMR